VTETAKILPKIDLADSSEDILHVAPEPVDRSAETIDIRPPLSAPPPNPGVNHEELQGAPLDEIRFRLKRHRVDQLENLELHFAFFDGDGRLLRTPVLDFSERGLGIASPDDLIVRSGEILKNVEVHAGARCVYRGQATVIHHPNRPDRLGMKLSGQGLDVDVLLQHDQRAGQMADFERHLLELREHLNPSSLSASYRALVADVVTLLAGLKAETEAMERSETWVELGTDELQQIEDLVGDEFVRLTNQMNQVASQMDPSEAYIAGQYAKRLLHPLLLTAPIPARAYDKPLGYAGDYQLMELIYRQRDACKTLFGKLVNRLCCRLRAAKAVVARVDLLTDFLLQEIESRRGRKVRIGSMACGPAEEVQRLFQRSLPHNTPVEVALIDQDREALTYCSRRMLQVESNSPLAQELSIGFFHTSVKTMVTNPTEVDSLLGKFDVLYTVGLFDYLAAPAARAMIKSMSRFLAPQGVLVIGNFCSHTGEAFMEHVLDWRLLYREDKELRELAQNCLSDMEGDFDINVISENNQTHLFLVLRKQ